MTAPIYLDYAATTPVDPLVAQAMSECLTEEGDFANPLRAPTAWPARTGAHRARAR